MPRHESTISQAARLSQNDCGRVLLSLIEEFRTQARIAELANTEPSTVAKWFKIGRMSRTAAIALAAATGREKEEFRPDLSEKQWAQEVCGRRVGKVSEVKSADGLLIAMLFQKHGGRKGASEAIGCTPYELSKWKSRGKIPANRVADFLASA